MTITAPRIEHPTKCVGKTIEKVIAGGQTGADQAGLRAARAAGITTGGWAPKGWKTEDGPAPWLADYGLREHESSDYSKRTEQNIIESDFGLLFGDCRSRGSRLFLRIEREISDAFRQPPLVIHNAGQSVTHAAHLLRLIAPKVLNIAGNRESASPGIGAWVEQYLVEVFRLLREAP